MAYFKLFEKVSLFAIAENVIIITENDILKEQEILEGCFIETILKDDRVPG